MAGIFTDLFGSATGAGGSCSGGGTSGGGSVPAGNYVEQLSTMPDASTKQGKIVQYVGAETGTYNHGAFYEAVAQAGGTNSYSDLQGYIDVSVDNTDTMFSFINAVLEHAGKSPLAVGDFVKIQQRLDDDGFPSEIWFEITPTGGVADRTDVDIEWVKTREDFMESGLGFSMSGTEDYMTFTVTGVAETTYVWQETTVDKLLEEMVENNTSVLYTTYALNGLKGGTKTVALTYLTAFGSLDSRPSHKAPGAIVINDNQNQIGIITDVDSRNATIVTVFTGFAGEAIPSGGGAYKFLGSKTTSTATWVYGLVLDDIYANASTASSLYFGDRPFMSKSGANDTTKFQSYTVIGKDIPSTYTLTSDSSDGKVTITDASALYAKINDLISQGAGYGSITELRPGLNIMLGLYAEDYYGTGAFQFSLSTLEISDMETMENWSGNMAYIGGESSLAEWGLASTLEGNTNGNIQITTGTIGGTFYLYESQGCAKVQAATETDPAYVFSMPGNMAQMGGIVDLPSMGPGVAVENTPVTLPRELANSNYVVQLTVITESGFQQIVVDASNRTTTGFDICARNNDSAETVTGAKVAWTVVGVMPMTLFTGQA